MLRYPLAGLSPVTAGGTGAGPGNSSLFLAANYSNELKY